MKKDPDNRDHDHWGDEEYWDHDHEPVTKSKPYIPEGTWPLQRDMEKFYGKVGTNQSKVHVPFPMYLAWGNKRLIEHITIHEKCNASLTRILQRIRDSYSPEQITANGYHIFGGSFNVRKISNSNNWSMHAWGAAVDFDPIRNQLNWGKNEAHLARAASRKFWEIWEEEGWLSLGRTRNFDWMHVQAARL